MEIGVITKPQALKGQFRVKPTGMNLLDMKELRSVIINNKEYDIEKIVLRDTFAIFKVVGIDDISQVEVLRNRPISISDEDTEELQEDEYYIDDLIGSKVVDDLGVELGVVSDVSKFGSASVITITNGDKEILFPHARNVIKNVDTDSKIVVVDRKIFEEIAL